MAAVVTVVATAAALWTASPAVMAAQPDGDLSAFIGRWQINPARTHMGRGNLTRSSTFTFIFASQTNGLRLDIYENYPQSLPTRSAAIVPDRRRHGCASTTGCQTVGGVPAEQSYAYFEIDPHMLIRVFYTQGKVTEYTSYAVSTDGKTFTMISWGAEKPEKENIQVFDRRD
jgi:hypothetical protein